MKKTDLYKNLGLKIDGKLKQAGTPDRFAQGVVLDRKEQRKIDQEKGLIPFAVKLNAQLANDLRVLAEKRVISMNELIDELLRKALLV
jgi:PP-loop superfamily ATP-utilizing enzyme